MPSPGWAIGEQSGFEQFALTVIYDVLRRLSSVILLKRYADPVIPIGDISVSEEEEKLVNDARNSLHDV